MQKRQLVIVLKKCSLVSERETELILQLCYCTPTTIRVGECAEKIRSRLDIGVQLHLVYSEYSAKWTDRATVQAIFDQSFVHMFRVHNAIHRPPEESSSSDEETSEEEEGAW